MNDGFVRMAHTFAKKLIAHSASRLIVLIATPMCAMRTPQKCDVAPDEVQARSKQR
jgi:hypothetical protein